MWIRSDPHRTSLLEVSWIRYGSRCRPMRIQRIVTRADPPHCTVSGSGNCVWVWTFKFGSGTDPLFSKWKWLTIKDFGSPTLLYKKSNTFHKESGKDESHMVCSGILNSRSRIWEFDRCKVRSWINFNFNYCRYHYPQNGLKKTVIILLVIMPREENCV